MAKYRKSTAIVDAVQWTDKPDSVAEVEKLGCWTRPCPMPMVTFLTVYSGQIQLCIELWDWVIKAEDNQFYSCPPDIFAQTYERATEILS